MKIGKLQNIKNYKLIIAIAIIVLLVASIVIGLIVASTKDKKKDTLRILNTDISLPLYVRTLEKIGFESSNEIKNKEQRTFINAEFIYKEQFASHAIEEGSVKEEGMCVYLDYEKLENSRVVKRIVFPVARNNGEYISINGLYMKDMSFDNVISYFGENYEVISGVTTGKLKTVTIEYQFDDFSANFVYRFGKFTELIITVNEQQEK